MNKIVIYQVLPRLFGNLKTTNKHNGTIEENGCGKFNDFTPLALQKIKELGISHIWYTGIIEHAHVSDYSEYGIEPDAENVVKGKAGSPYAIKDYYDVDPDLAVDVSNRLDEFEGLINRTHEAEMKVIIDFVPNHVARHYISDSKPEGVFDFGYDDKKDCSFSPVNNFYYLPGQNFKSPVKVGERNEKWSEYPAKVTGNDCLIAEPSISDWYETVKLNYGVNIFNGRSEYFDPIPDTWIKMRDILLYWAAKSIDGFRCDMAEMVPLKFWNWVIPIIKKQHPSVIFIGEVYNSSLYNDFIHIGKFDLLYDKVGMYETLRNVVQGNIDVSHIKQAWENISQIHHQILFFTENHDEQRLASDFYAGDGYKGWPATLAAATINSNPFMLYFGQEIGERGMDEEGYSGLDGRTSIFDYWGVKSIQNWVNNGMFDGGLLSDEQNKLRERHKKLFHLLVDDSAIYSGLFYDLLWYNKLNAYYNSQTVYSFFRYSENSALLIVINFSGKDEELRIRIPEEALHLAGINAVGYLSGHDLMGSESKISCPCEVAVNGGVGVKVKAYLGCVFQLK